MVDVQFAVVVTAVIVVVLVERVSNGEHKTATPTTRTINAADPLFVRHFCEHSEL